METTEDFDLDRLIQDELDALSLDDPAVDDVLDDDFKGIDTEQTIDETRQHLEREMHERLAAFENEIQANLNRYEIDYSEIDELLQKPIGDNDNDIQNNVARECGIEREELDRILQSINTEESSLDSTATSYSNEDDHQSQEFVRESTPTIESNESVEPTPREQEDPNKKLHEERLAESNRRMLDELALLEQRRKEEEQRYATVLQEQQIRLAEEYRRLQETLDESARQTRNEKLQFETLCLEQERVTNERHNTMALLIQAWYRGRRVYRQYHKEITKRAAPTLRAIAKKRKKKEQEELAKLAEIHEENDRQDEMKSIPLPSSNRISSPLPDVLKQQSNQVKKMPVVPPKEDLTKIKKPKPTSSSSLLTTEIVQMENPADFMPTIIPERRHIPSSPRKRTPNNNQRVSSPVPTKEQRPKSSKKRPSTTETEPIQTPILISENLSRKETVSIAEQVTIPINVDSFSTPMTRSDTFNKKPESPAPPLIETPRPISRSGTFAKENEKFSSPSIATIPSASLDRSTTFVGKPENTSQPLTVVPPAYLENRSNTFLNPNENHSPSSNEKIPVIEPLNIPPTDLLLSLKQTEMTSSPRVATPRKAPVEKKDPSKPMYSFLREARRWAENTRDITYSNLILSTADAIEQLPTRKTGPTLRKLPDIDPQLLAKAVQTQSPNEVRYLLLEQLLTPCSLSLIGTTYSHLTHLTLRQCKLVQLSGLDSCSSLTTLDIEGNWLEQIHLQHNHLEYLNVSRNRLTSLLSIHTPLLKYLNVSRNRLTRLNGIESLTQLNILLATSNQLLTTIGLQGCTHLLHIDVSDNHLVEMEQLEQCPLLITVKGTSNALIQVPNLSNAILLNELDLSSNSLTTLDELSIGSWMPFVTHLRLANNSLQEVSVIKLPALIELDLGFNQLFDASLVKSFLKACPSLTFVNLEQNPVLCDLTDSSFPKEKSTGNPISLLPQTLTQQTSETIRSYLNFLTNITSMFITLRQTVEQYQNEPFPLLQSIHQQCQQYHELKVIEPILPVSTDPKVVSPKEQSIIRLQALWRCRLLERRLNQKRRAARIIQACWRGYVVRRRMGTVRRLFSHQQQIFDEIDLTQFDFDEVAFDARFQRPRTPAARTRQVWQPHYQVLSKTTTVTELPRPNSSRSSSAASSRAKPLVEPLPMSSRTSDIANEWGFAPSSSTAALMLKRAEKMKWNAERKHKREHMDVFQRLQMARNNELPPGSLRLARRQPSLTNTSKPIVLKQALSPPSTSHSRPNRVFEWVHTQVARFDESSSEHGCSPSNERKRLPSLDGSTDSTNRVRPNEILQQQQQRWSSSTASVRQPPPLLPPINGQLPRL